MDPLLKVENLHTHFIAKEFTTYAVNGVNFDLGRESVVALVGESGAGKTTTALSIMGILPRSGKVAQGRVLLEGVDILALPQEERRKVKGKEIAMVLQDPVAALSPICTIKQQMEEGILAHRYAHPKELQSMCEDLLRDMEIADPKRVLDSYPFQLSGGMCQRVVLAIAMALRPKVLIADEPTSDLDLTVQAQILTRLRRLTEEFHTSLLLITHDWGIVAHMAEHVVVLYAGWAVERGPVRTIFDRPLSPYTQSLLETLAMLGGHARRLPPPREMPVNLLKVQERCPYLPRCPKAINTCRLEAKPPLEELESGHWVACYNPVSYD